MCVCCDNDDDYETVTHDYHHDCDNDDDYRVWQCVLTVCICMCMGFVTCRVFLKNKKCI